MRRSRPRSHRPHHTKVVPLLLLFPSATTNQTTRRSAAPAPTTSTSTCSWWTTSACRREGGRARCAFARTTSATMPFNMTVCSCRSYYLFTHWWRWLPERPSWALDKRTKSKISPQCHFSQNTPPVHISFHPDPNRCSFRPIDLLEPCERLLHTMSS